MNLNFCQKLGAYLTGEEYGLDPLETRGILQLDEQLTKSAIDPSVHREALLAAIKAVDRGSTELMLRHKAKKTRRAIKKEDEERELEKVAAGDDGKAYELAKLVFLTSMLAGHIGGAGYYAINQHARKEKIQNEALKRRIDLYRNVTGELGKNLGTPASGQAPTG